ncbi:MAG: lipopolysaccharide transport periplasmic protein LptA [Endozoicomonas sp. (ex Botrylloides leachii)]|nr:lipopolysaccharide transport periplasmic protein LptA [Endozoicomonas sp. (ex Botrylloides leachii)]
MNLIKPAILAIMLAPAIAIALPSDRYQKIEVVSNSASLDSKKGISIYSGNVIMTQGSIRLTGDTITLYNDKNNEITRIIAQGKRAFYEEKLEGKRGKAKAWGNTIKYNVTDHRVDLLQQAELSQDGDLFKGEAIHYDLATQRVNATGQPAGTSAKGRVHMIIQPKPENGKRQAGS